MWFLAGSSGHKAERYCTILAGKSILTSILNSECSYAEFPALNTYEDLRLCAKKMEDSVVSIEASIDNVSVSSLEQSRLQSPLFILTPGGNIILGLPANITTQAVSDVNWLFLKPLAAETHLIYFMGGLEGRNTRESNNSSNETFAGPYGWDNAIIYHNTIIDSSPPTPLLESYPNQTGA